MPVRVHQSAIPWADEKRQQVGDAFCAGKYSQSESDAAYVGQVRLNTVEWVFRQKQMARKHGFRADIAR